MSCYLQVLISVSRASGSEEDGAEGAEVSGDHLIVSSMTLNIVRGRRVNGGETGQDGGHGGGLPVHQAGENIGCPDTRGSH